MKTALITVLLCLVSTVALAADEQVVFTQAANGTRNTRPFTVADRWELRWDVKGPKLSIFLFMADGERQGLLPIVTQDKAGTGSSYYPKAGSYYLKVLADGDWTISVVQLP